MTAATISANQHEKENLTFIGRKINVKFNNDYSVQNDESLCGHCTNERTVRKRDKKVRRDVI